MRVCNLSSGSDGNLTYIESASAKILVDIGLSCAETVKRLALLGVRPDEINAVLITHEHTDHMRGLDVFASKYKPKIYVHARGINAVFNKTSRLNKHSFYEFEDSDFSIEDIIVSAISLPHDSFYCSGFCFINNGKKISIITDLGHTNDVIISKIMGSSLVYIESNHDVDMLKQNSNYSASLKARILGKKGHLSNFQAAEVIEKLVQGGTKQIMLSHLSKHNNTPQLAYKTVCNYLKCKGIEEGVHVKISVASVMPSAIFKLN